MRWRVFANGIRMAVLLGLCTAVSGEVFLKRPRATLGEVPGTAREILRRQTEVNGIPGTLTVYLEQDTGAEGTMVPLDSLNEPAWTRTELPGGGSLWQLLVPGDRADMRVLFSSDGDLATGAPRWPFARLACPAGLQTRFSVQDADGPVAAAIGSAAGADAAAVQSALRDALAAAGWRVVTPEAGSGAGVLAQGRGGEIAYAAAWPDARGACAWIVLTRKPVGE